ncbi:TPA_exp: Uncharacterized protein A8136_4366 [Trichophyton benhamiae CBS 112371]|uniref:DUF7730 domain-containing protein n=1 Tax=Arthroderma benhamiae (strain ATCC MYA-4681 / CBS 112371) TaxID=663331 RepID=D4AMY6_ARTBC|nr:uncharacterized protein ARB_05589 [Trichophyton benhamiae CBS 112371]EFE35547.1 hypothetical protein ARB_05589 [Trichophyton benhamiae CBS 112371]DAA78390.1 TPA_exp: Uncharacterized protein A8136_4366 [Trichophyton benhamiae CBS 112371]
MATDSSILDESQDTLGFKSPQLPQTQSILFTRLPAELRERVYFFVFGGFPRIKPDEKPLYWISGGAPRRLKNHAVDKSMTLLQACQRMYFEAFDFFYQNITFKVFTPLTDVTLFPTAAHNSIRTLWVDIRLNSELGCDCCDEKVEGYFDEATWSKTVKVLNERLPGLRHLHISIIRRKESRSGDYFRPLLEEKVYPTLMGMKKLHCFQVVVNFENVVPANAPFEMVTSEYSAAYEIQSEREWLSDETEEEESTDNVEEEYVTQYKRERNDSVDGWKIVFH